MSPLSNSRCRKILVRAILRFTPSDIPGYYFDPKSNRYFKIEKQEIPGFVTQTQIKQLRASELNQHTYDKMIRRTMMGYHNQPLNLLQHLSLRELAKSNRYGAQYIFLRNFRQRHSNRIVVLKPVLLNPLSGQQLFAIRSDTLQSYSIVWTKKSKSSPAKPEIRPVDQDQDRYTALELSTTHCRDLSWSIPGTKFALLAESVNCDVLYGVDCADGICHIRTKQVLPKVRSRLKLFVSNALVLGGGQQEEAEITDYSFQNCNSSNCNPLPILTSKKLFLALFEADPITFIDMSHCNNFQMYSCCLATPWNSGKSYEINRSESSCASSLTIYLAGKRQGLGFLSLCQTTAKQKEPHHLIKFKTICGSYSQDFLNVTSLQALCSTSGDREGLLVSYLNGLVQLWDDRWPNRPSIEYFGSYNESALKLASHIAPRPIVGLTPRPILISSLIASPYIATWDLYTGQVLTICQLSNHAERPSYSTPPSLFYRNFWTNWEGVLCKGPAILSLDYSHIDWFSI